MHNSMFEAGYFQFLRQGAIVYLGFNIVIPNITKQHPQNKPQTPKLESRAQAASLKGKPQQQILQFKRHGSYLPLKKPLEVNIIDKF